MTRNLSIEVDDEKHINNNNNHQNMNYSLKNDKNTILFLAVVFFLTNFTLFFSGSLYSISSILPNYESSVIRNLRDKVTIEQTIRTIQFTDKPTAQPTFVPFSIPTAEPTYFPTTEPTSVPTAEPTAEPTEHISDSINRKNYH